MKRAKSSIMRKTYLKNPLGDALFLIKLPFLRNLNYNLIVLFNFLLYFKLF